MADDALDIALGLWRVPALRAVLRTRALPVDVGSLLELASGAPLQLRSAAQRCGESEASLLEATRFYAREVLMFEGADAWRTLGSRPGASEALLKQHHRWLQHWLHPDRNHAPGDAIHATRVNAAWAQLRTAERRAAYSDDIATQGADEAARHGAQRIVVTGWRAVPGQAAPRGRSWIAMGAVALACGGLFVLVVRKANDPAPEWPGGPVAASAGPAGRQALQGPPSEPVQWRGVARQAIASPVPPAQRPDRRAIATAHEAGEPQAVVRPTGRSSAVGEPPDMPLPPVSGTIKAGTQATVARSVSSGAGMPASAAASPPIATSEAPGTEAQQPAIASPGDDLDVERATLAQQRGSEVTQYLQATSAHVPPIWRSVDAQDEAAAIRQRVGSRAGKARGGPRFAAPRWSIDNERAFMTADIVSTVPGSEAGRLQVELAWRDEMWLVDHIELVGL